VPHTCTTCGRELAEAPSCPYCSQPTPERAVLAEEDMMRDRTQPPIVWWAILASAASLVLPALAIAHMILTDIPAAHSLTRTVEALTALVGGAMACLGLVLSIIALARWREQGPPPTVRLVVAILCCLAALPVNLWLLMASQWVQ
jgi:hypothetical protein